MSIYYVKNDELMHYGIKGQKWGVRRYQNPDGTLTPAGKKRQARIDASDAKYRQKQTVKTSKYYDKNRRYGPLGLYSSPGIETLEKKLNSKSKRLDKDSIKEEILYKKYLKDYELKKVSQLTHEQINQERIAVGKQAVDDLLLSAAISSVLIPTTGFAFIDMSNPQSTRSAHRLKD